MGENRGQSTFSHEAGTQRFQRFAYDHEGRTTFASYPATAHNPTTGTWTEYDALGRPTSVSQDSELTPSLLTTTMEYLAGFQTRVTNPKGHQTTTRYLAWDQPTTDFPVQVTHPAGAYTHIARDVFGKPTLLRRSNSGSPTGGTVAVDRAYAYNAHQELCRAVEPETGATLLGYDGAGNLKWSAAGLPSGQACEVNGTTPAVAARRVDRTYDGRNKLRTLGFPDARGNQAWTYTLDGLPASITTYNGLAGTEAVVNAYSYNKRRMLAGEGESISQPGWYAWGVGYGYDGNGHLATQTYPTGLAVAYAPNALGQPTGVTDNAGRTHASGVGYFPNGSIRQFTYGNGIVHTMTQNARQLPLRVSATGNAMDSVYAYDANGNVASILDHVTGTPTARHRWMAYDALDRLTSAESAVFGGADHAHRFSYDALDNLTSWKHLGVKDYAEYVYDAGNRLTNIRNSGGSSIVGLGYDAQGNLANKNGQGYVFDYGNRLRQVTGKETYRYDGHGRRVQTTAVATGRQQLWQYGQGGQMLFWWEGVGNEKTREYVYLGGSLIATIEHAWPGNAVTAIRYQHTDALGSPVAVTDPTGTVVERNDYEPYGAVIGKPAYSGIGYTGHVMDGATGLTYMQQRYYDQVLGIFLSVDPVTAYSSPITQFHRYRYANNNPYKFIDPDGRLGCAASRITAVCNSYGWGSVVSTSFRSTMDSDSYPRTTLVHKPVAGKINTRDSKTSTADGGYDPTGSKRLRSNGARRHQGIDIKAEVGTPVVAAQAGTARNRSDPDGYGIYIDISHGEGLSTRYAHLKSSSVENGQAVSGGEEIGKVGRTGNLSPQTQSHLHFEVRRDDVPQDPLSWFNYDYDE